MDFSPAAVASPPVENGHARARHGPTAVAPGLGATTTSRPVSALAEAESESKIEPGSCPAPIRPESLHPSLWLGHQLAQHADLGIATGFPALDAQLPGGGWPRRALTELLLPHPGIGELRLLAPSLVGTQHAGRLVMLFDPPAALSATALAQLGFRGRRVARRQHPHPGDPGGPTACGRSSRRSRAVTSARCWPGCRRGCGPSACAACNSPPTPTTARRS